jgi:hypothetical protein
MSALTLRPVTPADWSAVHSWASLPSNWACTGSTPPAILATSAPRVLRRPA